MENVPYATIVRRLVVSDDHHRSAPTFVPSTGFADTLGDAMSDNTIDIRVAVIEDCEEIERLITDSARVLGRAYYTDAEIEAALRSSWGLDTQLVRDGTYFLAFCGGVLAGCGGWSFRRTLFGSDAGSSRDDTILDPQTDAARIRAFFVSPRFARLGIGSMLLGRCEQEARAAGFRALCLTATHPGQHLYAARGFMAGQPFVEDLGRGIKVPVIPMKKILDEDS